MHVQQAASLHEKAVQRIASEGLPDFGPDHRNHKGHRTSNVRNLTVDRRVWAAVQQSCRDYKRRIQIVSEAEVWLY